MMGALHAHPIAHLGTFAVEVRVAQDKPLVCYLLQLLLAILMRVRLGRNLAAIITLGGGLWLCAATAAVSHHAAWETLFKRMYVTVWIDKWPRNQQIGGLVTSCAQ